MDLNQITIPSINVAKATEFYKTLGLYLIVDALPRYVRFECPNGHSTFSIHKVDKLPKGNGITLYFEDDHLDTLVKNLQKKGINFAQLPEDKTWLWREAHLYDLDGNKIILYHAGNNRKNPPWRIN
ncbi:VOC family protein [Seonamhaeicola algicola]|uniref:VOC family protein n=1 Tax=Seonamhaeicola algicola TaxID=1719036 RepID=A0A5C7AZN8_9FLAO|nr:VOC family protein [Seonamhaeicola algicola]TXE11112.1 VOC family protein [Seonamhaeicola algicola]